MGKLSGAGGACARRALGGGAIAGFWTPAGSRQLINHSVNHLMRRASGMREMDSGGGRPRCFE